MKIDLHIHTSASDGSMNVGEVIKVAKEQHVDMIAICDHDTIDSVEQSLTLAKKSDITVISGIEFSAAYEMDIHILGYLMDHENSELVDILQGFKSDRLKRIYRYVEYLNKLNIDISFEDVSKMATGQVLGRVHIAKALVEKNYADDIEDAFKKYLKDEKGNETGRQKISAKRCIELIAKAGGISVLAHPCYMYDENFEHHLNELILYGLNGIEIFHPDQTDEQAKFFEKMAIDKGLLVTSGSDFHGSVKPEINIGSEKRTSKYLEFCNNLLYKKAKEIYS